MVCTERELDEALAVSMDGSDAIPLTDTCKRQLTPHEIDAAFERAGWSAFVTWLRRMNCNEVRLVSEDWIEVLHQIAQHCYNGNRDSLKMMVQHLERGPLNGELLQIAELQIQRILDVHLPTAYHPTVLSGQGDESGWQTKERYM